MSKKLDAEPLFSEGKHTEKIPFRIPEDSIFQSKNYDVLTCSSHFMESVLLHLFFT